MRIFSIFFGLILTSVSIAQQVPYFSTLFYFQDSKGNVDSLILGFDPRANRVFNSDFGEISLSEPFADDLDVRASHDVEFNQDPVLSKKIVTCSDKIMQTHDPNHICNIGCSIIIYIKSDNFPVSIRWNPHAFKDSVECIEDSYMTSDFLSEITDPAEIWFRDTTKRAVCLKENSQYSINLDPEFTKQNYPLEFSYLLIRNYPDLTTDSVYGIKLNFVYNYDLTPCHRKVVNLDNEAKETDNLILYPNPTTGDVYLSGDVLESIEYWILYDSQGQLMDQQEFLLTKPEINLADLEAGFYIIAMTKKSGDVLYKQIIKF